MWGWGTLKGGLGFFGYIFPRDIGALFFDRFYELRDTMTAFKMTDQFSGFACFPFAFQVIIICIFQVKTERAQFILTETFGECLVQFAQVLLPPCFF